MWRVPPRLHFAPFLPCAPVLLCALILLCVAGGCAEWSAELTGDNVLPIPRMSPDSVVLEIAFVPVPEEDFDLQRELWDFVDEQHLPTELRRRLARNGFRVGIMGEQLPGSIQQLLDERTGVVESLVNAAGTSGTEPVARRERRQIRAGRRAQIVASHTVHASLVALYRDDEGAIRGDTFEHAQCVFSLISHPTGDGRVQLELTPEVQHGQPRQGWVGHEGAFRWDAERERRVFERLRIEAMLSPGQTIVLSSTHDAVGLGGQFFTPDPKRQESRRVLLIRLAQTQFDDLFAPDRMIAPLATPSP